MNVKYNDGGIYVQGNKQTLINEINKFIDYNNLINDRRFNLKTLLTCTCGCGKKYTFNNEKNIPEVSIKCTCGRYIIKYW